MKQALYQLQCEDQVKDGPLTYDTAYTSSRENNSDCRPLLGIKPPESDKDTVFSSRVTEIRKRLTQESSELWEKHKVPQQALSLWEE